MSRKKADNLGVEAFEHKCRDAPPLHRGVRGEDTGGLVEEGHGPDEETLFPSEAIERLILSLLLIGVPVVRIVEVVVDFKPQPLSVPLDLKFQLQDAGLPHAAAFLEHALLHLRSHESKGTAVTRLRLLSTNRI